MSAFNGSLPTIDAGSPDRPRPESRVLGFPLWAVSRSIPLALCDPVEFDLDRLLGVGLGCKSNLSTMFRSLGLSNPESPGGGDMFLVVGFTDGLGLTLRLATSGLRFSIDKGSELRER